jgi:hypothetical protein
MHRLLPVLSLAFAAALGLPAFADDAPPPPSISIEGHGEVVSAPDTALVTAGVTSDAKTAREALDGNTKAMAGLIATLKAAGIDAKDLQTSGFSVNPQYIYPEKLANGAAPPPEITGYEVQNGVSLKVRKLDTLGTILDQIVSVGGNTINGISFSVDDAAQLLDEARKAAFTDAEGKARIYADAAGIGLGPVQSIREGGDDNEPRPVAFKTMAAPMAGTAVPVEAGQLTFDVSVDVVWGIRGAP